MATDIVSAVIGLFGGLVGGAVVAGVNIWTERRRYQTERAKLLSIFTSPAEIEKARIHAYSELWRCLEGISTYRPAEIAAHLPATQAKLQHWYYAAGGGLLISGAAELEGSTKAAFFVARDLDSRDAVEIWRVFHRLRRCLRRDLRIFEDENEEQAALNDTKAKLTQLGG